MILLEAHAKNRETYLAAREAARQTPEAQALETATAALRETALQLAEKRARPRPAPDARPARPASEAP